MQRVTISMDEGLAEAFDALSDERGYQSRSEAVRDLVRKAVEARRLEADNGSANCVANLSYVYDVRARGVAGRLSEVGADNHTVVLMTVQAPLDHDMAFASTMLRGPTIAVRALADGIAAERGVRFAKLNVVSIDLNDHHSEPHDHHRHGQEHLSPHPG